MTQKLKSPLFLIYLAVFVNILAFSMVFPLLPLYAKQFQAPEGLIGVMASLFALAQLLFSPFWGILSDKFGRKPIIAAGLIGVVASFLVFGFAASLPVLFVSRFLQGMFAGAVLPAARAYAADITTKQDRVKVMGRIGAALSLGVIFGPAIGGTFAQVGLSFPFFAAATVAFINFLFVLFLLPESLTQKAQGIIRAKKLIFSNFSALWRGTQSSLAPLLILAFLWSFAFSNNQVAVPLLGLEKFRLTPADVGILFAVLGGVSAIVQFFFLEKIAKKIGQHKTIFLGMAVMALGFSAMPFSPSVIFLYIATGIAGLGSAVTRPVITALISEETNIEQGATMGMANAYESLGRFVGPLAGGFLFGLLSFLPFVLAGTVVGAVLLSLLIFKKGFFGAGHRI